MNNVTNFDTTKYRLGRVCKEQHNWQNTEFSLRYISDGSCIDCAKNRATKWHKANVEKTRKSGRDFYARNSQLCLQKTKAWQRRNKNRLLSKLQEWNHSEEGKEKKRHYAHSERRKALTTSNRERIRESSRQCYKKRTETYEGRLSFNKYSIKRRTLKRLNHSVLYTAKQLRQRYQDFDNSCAYCGVIATSIDHVIPISKGGCDALGNLLPSCKSCNSGKSNSDLETWYKASPNFTPTRWKRILKLLGLTERTLGQIPLF